jgi:adenylate cyclase
MGQSDKILVVDDVPQNVKLLADLLNVEGHTVVTAASGPEALAKVAAEAPDLILLDIVMPQMTGYEVCRRLRADPATAVLPIVLVTSLDATEERVKGIEAGADDFLNKPINSAELLARVRSLLRIKQYHDTVQTQAAQLAEWNRSLEDRVREQVTQLERLGKLKRFFSPQISQVIEAGGDELLRSHRREITAVFVDLRGFTAFAETAEPEDVMSVLNDYHREMGRLILSYDGTLEHYAGDGIMVFFNDPVPVANAAERAVRMALEMRRGAQALAERWRSRDYALAAGVGIATGYATLGVIGFEGRWDYAAIGTVTNLAARLCAEAGPGQIITTRKTLVGLEPRVNAEPLGELVLKGLARPVPAFNLLGWRE